MFSFNYKDLTYHFKTKESSPKRFSDFDCLLGFLRKIRDGDITLEETRKIKENLSQV